MDVYGTRSKYWPAYTWKVQTSYSKDIKGSTPKELKISEDEFGKIYFYIFEKLNASFYHLQRLKENQEDTVKLGQELAKIKFPGTDNMVGIAGVPYEPIGYEYESFLVTIKTTLDLVSILIARSFSRGEDNIISLLHNIKSRKSKRSSLQEEIYSFLESSKFTGLVDSFRDPDKDKDKKSKRNFAVHRGSLPLGTINVPINNPTASVLLTKAFDPNKPDSCPSRSSTDLIEYCESHFYQTCDLVIGVLSIFSGKKFEPGPKSNVYEQKHSLNKNR